MPRQTPRDLCKGCRECYNGILEVVVKSPFVAGLMMGIPTYFMLSALIFDGSVINFYPELYAIKNSAQAPYYTLLAFTITAWFTELIAIKTMLPNLLSICAFGHSAVGSWWFVNFGILMFAGWVYIPIRLMFIVMISLLTPSIIWHITGDIIREYKRKLINEISLASQSMANQDAIFRGDGAPTDLEVGLKNGVPK